MPGRRARPHTDRARVWVQWASLRRPHGQLLSAHREALTEVRNRPSIRRLTADLVHDHRGTHTN